ncbi:homoaconitase [Rhodocollybia butyracea]|uniref:Homoaconitase, mitochondrial n=1 Tax=Rhodocollybia butyracea TaxID=206335 RepID=A0A9P5Q214_9AGAR|nr:homoaconitase [Rhodocollybia butyracea]
MILRRARRAAALLRRDGHRTGYATTASPNKVPQSVIEKVVQRYAVGLPPGHTVQAGDYVMIRPEHVMTHDNTGPVISKFKSIGATSIHNPRQPVFTLDHDVQNKSPTNLKKYSTIEAFARTHDIDFYPAGRGIGHQILIEEGYAFPYTLTVASDSHSNMYGGVSGVGTPIVRTDAAALWATGKTWWQVPRIIQVELQGELRPGVTGKDVIVALCGYFNQDEVLNAALEFTGEGVNALSVEDRLTIANMTTEWGALAGVFPVDKTLLEWYDQVINKLEQRTFASSESLAIPPPPEHPRLNRRRISDLKNSLSLPSSQSMASDPGASYAQRLVFHLSSLIPHVSGPNSVKISTPLPALESQKIPINKAYLVSCTNSRVGDLAAAADVFRSSDDPNDNGTLRKVDPSVEFYIAAASSTVQAESQARGDWDVLVRAGAKVLPAGCGPCIGLGVGLLEEGEVGISATNRNYKGRMGHPKAQAYLASPAVVAASAVKGYISGPSVLDRTRKSVTPIFSIVDSTPSALNAESPTPSASAAIQTQIIPPFPTSLNGPVLFLPADNVSTDAIYPGKYTYQDGMTREEMGRVVLENYDVEASNVVRELREGLGEGAWVHTPSVGAADAEMKQNVSERVTLNAPLLISGFNFGTGSSREQAATSLLAAGVPMVIAGSFGDIFKRNSINNGLICIECPVLIEDLTTKLATGGKRSGNGEMIHGPALRLDVNMALGEITLMESQSNRVYPFKSVGASVQDLWICGGLEGLVLKELKENKGN